MTTLTESKLRSIIATLQKDIKAKAAALDALRRIETDMVNALGSLGEVEQTEHRRGRKSMPASERKEVSARMKKYWASRRAANKADAASARRNMEAM